MPPLTNRLRAYPIRQTVQPLGSIALIDNSFQDRASFIEAFSMKYRECEGLIAEVCA